MIYNLGFVKLYVANMVFMIGCLRPFSYSGYPNFCHRHAVMNSAMRRLSPSRYLNTIIYRSRKDGVSGADPIVAQDWN